MAKTRPVIVPRRPVEPAIELRYGLYADEGKTLVRAFATLAEAVDAAQRFHSKEFRVKDRGRIVWP